MQRSKRLAHIKWCGDNVIKSLSSCRTNVRFLKEIVHHVTRWAAEVREDIQDELNPPSRNVRPRLAEPQPANAPPPGPPAEVDELEQDLE